MNYGFFDYKYNIAGYDGSDFYGIMHVVYVLICILAIPLLINRLKDKESETITRIIRVSAVLLIIEEIAKISWESYWDIKTGHGFNAGGILPLETCSLFIYTLAAAGFTKGRIRECALSWMSSIGVAGGISYIICTNALKWYPFFTYGAFHSMIFHFMMVFIGLLIPYSGYYRFKPADNKKAFIPQLAMALVVVPLDYVFNWDYMLLHYAGGVPVIEDIGEILALNNFPYVTTLLMLLLYYLLGSLFIVFNIQIQNHAGGQQVNQKAFKTENAVRN